MLYILIVGFLVRAALWWALADAPVTIVDAQDYNRLAVGLAETGSYLDASGRLTSLRPPLYPATVSVLYRFFGIENHAAVRAFDAAISLLTTVLVYWLGVELYSRRIGLVAAALHCFYPSLLGFNNLLLSEPLFTFFVVLMTCLAVRVVKAPRPTYAAALGLTLALGALTRSVLWLFAPVLAVYLFATMRTSWPQRILQPALMMVVFLAAFAPWAYRNTQVQKTLTFVDVMGGRNLMMGNYEHTPLERSWATIATVRGDKAWHRVLAAETPGYSQLTQGQIDKLAMKRGIKFFFAHLGLSLQRSAVKFFNFWQLDRTLVAGAQQGYFGQLSKPVVLLIGALVCGAFAAVVLLSMYGICLVPPQDWRLHGLVLLIGAFPCALHTVAFAHSRYLLPFVPLLMVYSASALVQWRSVLARRRHWSFALATGLCLLLIAGWTRELVLVDLELLK